MKREFNYSKNGVEYVTVNYWVAKRRKDNATTSVVGKLVNGKLVKN
jgi:hypothetical protein